MLFRFSLYGFLKNQRYFEPFLVLAFMEKGLSFSQIGLLIGFRELCINIMEIPTGALADVAGRRRAMIYSSIAYSVSFLVFGLSDSLFILFAAMFLFSIGEAFRTGTHKAMIFDWLKHEGRDKDKTAIYGYTRSWSKLGSAVSALAAAALMFFSDNYSRIFLLSIVPTMLNIVNFLTYPKYLDGNHSGHKSVGAILSKLKESISFCFTHKPLRRLLIESTNFEGLFKASKDYLQPIIEAMALSIPVFLYLDGQKRTAILIGLVYFTLHLLSSFASRHAKSMVKGFKSEAGAGRMLWFMYGCSFVIMGVAIYFRQNWIVLINFIILAILQNFWRPILISRCATEADSDKAATILSVESQTKSLFVVVMAPAIGWSIDYLSKAVPHLKFLPIAGLGILISLWMLKQKKKD